MSLIEQLQLEKEILMTKTDEEYVNENYSEHLVTNFTFIPKILAEYEMGIETLDRYFSLALITQAIIIYLIISL